jgi:hypothetical protein
MELFGGGKPSFVGSGNVVKTPLRGPFEVLARNAGLCETSLTILRQTTELTGQ